MTEQLTVGFADDEVLTGESTRAARLKWVVVVSTEAPLGLQVNAAVCIAATTGAAVTNLIGPAGVDRDGNAHPGLPWAGCSVLGATAEQLDSLAAAARQREGVFVVDMPEAAQTSRVYDDYLAALAESAVAEVRPVAIGILGARREVDKLTKRLSLLG